MLNLWPNWIYPHLFLIPEPTPYACTNYPLRKQPGSQACGQNTAAPPAAVPAWHVCPWPELLPPPCGSGQDNSALPREHAEGRVWTALTRFSLWLDRRHSWEKEKEGMRAAPLPGGLCEVGRAHCSLGLGAYGESSGELQALPSPHPLAALVTEQPVLLGGSVEWGILGTWPPLGILGEAFNLSLPKL